LIKKDHPRSQWDLPQLFREVPISYHSKDSWKVEGYFQSAHRGQEFVVQGERKIEWWVRDLWGRVLRVVGEWKDDGG